MERERKGWEGERRWKEGFRPPQKFWGGAPYGLKPKSGAIYTALISGSLHYRV